MGNGITTLKAPFPYFGGKSIIAPIVWERFGNVHNFVEPFFGSGAVLLGRPLPFEGRETINDACGFVCNFWRAVQREPASVAAWCDQPVNDNEMHASHAWLIGLATGLPEKLEGNKDYFDPEIAGRWCHGLCCWIGSGWCSGNGSWQSVEAEDGFRRLLHLGRGRGVHRQLVHLGRGRGVHRQLVHLGRGRGVHRQRVHLGDAGKGENGLYEWFAALSDRLRRVRVCCGDWERVCGPTPTVRQGLTAVFLDPPYADTADRDPDIYCRDSLDVAHRVREWCLEYGDDPKLRIALCGYEGEHVMPETWECVAWKTIGGYGSQSDKHDNPNAKRERVWFSPGCLKPERDRYPLFASIGDES